MAQFLYKFSWAWCFTLVEGQLN